MSYGSIDPAGDIIVWTPSDTNDIVDSKGTKVTSRFIRVVSAGNVQLTTAAGNVVICAFAAGETRAIRASRIWATNTGAVGNIELLI